MRDVFIAGATRTAVGRFGGGLSGVTSVELGRIAIEESLKRAGVKPEQVDEVIMGCVLTAGLGQNVARQCAVRAGIPIEVPSFTINKVCGSGLKSIALGVQAIALGDADLIISGGTENMSAAPFLLEKARWGYRMGAGELKDSMIYDGLWEIFNDYHMGITAENVAEKYGIGREEQDKFSLESQRRACAAIKDGSFKEEIVPVEVSQRKGDPKIFDTDEHPREDTSLEGLARLRGAFKKDGSVTAGNASGLNDGAAAVVLASGEKVKEFDINPIARIVAYASAGVDPAYMGMGPAPATRKVLEKAGLTLNDIELIELNEAFAAQSLAVIKELGIENRMDTINVNGGAVALGHPIGVSGTRILVTLLYAMRERGAKRGLAALCIGGGQGIAMIVERG